MLNIESPGVPIKAWVDGVPVEDEAVAQLRKCALLPVVHPHVAVMPDVHLGFGATVGSVIPTIGAIIPAAVGVDIGCGMMAVRLAFNASELPDNLAAMRTAIEKVVPHGRTASGGPGDRGAWGTSSPKVVDREWAHMASEYEEICERHPKMRAYNNHNHLGTLGTGNHFIELCLDESQNVWVMLHSGSRGVGNRIGSYFTTLAREDMAAAHGDMPTDKDLCYLTDGTLHFDDYVQAVSWAQRYAMVNRKIMMSRVRGALAPFLPPELDMYETVTAVNCHHNYVQKETHFGEHLFVTRKGAVSARAGELGIIPGSMGARSYIVRGKGNADSFNSCSHGAGRAMSRGEAKRRFTVDDHIKATAGIECRKDAEVVDETPMAYKNIDHVMAAQADLVEVVHTLRQVLCVKG